MSSDNSIPAGLVVLGAILAICCIVYTAACICTWKLRGDNTTTQIYAYITSKENVQTVLTNPHVRNIETIEAGSSGVRFVYHIKKNFWETLAPWGPLTNASSDASCWLESQGIEYQIIK